jgi:hypothetical protein
MLKDLKEKDQVTEEWAREFIKDMRPSKDIDQDLLNIFISNLKQNNRIISKLSPEHAREKTDEFIKGCRDPLKTEMMYFIKEEREAADKKE